MLHNVGFRRSIVGLTLRDSAMAPWWVLVLMIRNLFVTLCVSIFEDAYWQRTYMVCILAVYLFLLQSFRPYAYYTAQCIDTLCSLSLIIIIACAGATESG